MKVSLFKSIVLGIILILLPVTSAAQGNKQYDRSELTVKSQQVKNSEGDVEAVKVGVYAGKKQLNEYTYELEPAIPKEMSKLIGVVTETDLNFDGIPDADIYLGYLGGYANNTHHEALLWNAKNHCFEQAENYGEIGEPMVDEEGQYITTVLSAGPDHRETSYYRWHGKRLEHYLSEVWAIESDEVTDFSGVLNLPSTRIDCKLDGKIPVNMIFQRKGDCVAGYIYYPKAKHPAPIMMIGTVTEYEGKDYYYLKEYQADGIITGSISLTLKTDTYPEFLEGTWTNPKTEKEMTMQEMTFSRDAPKWYTTSLFVPEDPGNIGKEYSFQKYDMMYGSMMGGHITFKAAGKNKVHFECGNVRHNIAEGSSDPNRPAVLKGNMFEYRDVNECGYGFRATFYKRFAYLETITGNETLDCFGMGASFDGIYIKVKQ